MIGTGRTGSLGFSAVEPNLPVLGAGQVGTGIGNPLVKPTCPIYLWYRGTGGTGTQNPDAELNRATTAV